MLRRDWPGASRRRRPSRWFRSIRSAAGGARAKARCGWARPSTSRSPAPCSTTKRCRWCPDESRLAGAVISMAPFEIVGSVHPADHARRRAPVLSVRGTRSASSTPTPSLPIFRSRSSRCTTASAASIAANASVQGRDLTYILPPQSVRVLSMVTADAADIRDSSERELLARSNSSCCRREHAFDLAALDARGARHADDRRRARQAARRRPESEGQAAHLMGALHPARSCAP